MEVVAGMLNIMEGVSKVDKSRAHKSFVLFLFVKFVSL